MADSKFGPDRRRDFVPSPKRIGENYWVKTELKVTKMRPRGALGSELQLAYLTEVLCPQIAEIYITRFGIHPSMHGEVIEKSKCQTVRGIANEYGVSHETVRRTVNRPVDV